MEMTRKNLIDCHNRIKPFIHNTPVLKSSYINEITGADVYFKCENFQKMGAFKMRVPLIVDLGVGKTWLEAH